MACSEKNCMKRLKRDLEELRKSPVDSVSAAPLEENMLEWHCNIRQGDIIFHLILFFSKDYPSKSPSAEFVPSGFKYSQGATKKGKKGTQICLSIFSDFEFVHTEWATEKGHGWSPGYTVQTVLMNVVSFLLSNETTSDGNLSHNLIISQKFTCSDCGHSYTKPYPSLGNDAKEETVSVMDDSKSTAAVEKEIIDYYSKEKFTKDGSRSDGNVFGYGIKISGSSSRPTLTTPCEFLTARSFSEMIKTTGTASSILKDKLSCFLPLYIHPSHGSFIQDQFEQTMLNFPERIVVIGLEDMVLSTLPNLMCATVVQMFKEAKNTSENNLNGYFALHRLFLWACDIYPDLQEKVEKILKDFVDDEQYRTKTRCPDIGQWLMLLTASRKYRWQDVAKAYMNECHRRNVMWYMKDDPELGYAATNKEYRLKYTFMRTNVSRSLLAFQVVFMDIAMPDDLTRDDIIKRYDDNWGFPTEDMVHSMKSQCSKILNEIQTYADWYKILKLPVQTDQEIFENLVDSLLYAKSTPGYYFSR